MQLSSGMQTEIASLQLVGNSFPLSLVRRPVRIVPQNMDSFTQAMRGGWRSFWGHNNTLSAAMEACGLDLTPERERPALTLSAEGYPVFEGIEFRSCWIVSPNYLPGFRPAPGVEVASEEITGWSILRIEWE